MSQNCICETPVMELPVLGLSLAVSKNAIPACTGGIDYSLEEQWTGRYWVNGKKIYQRTMQYATLPANATVYHPLNISGLDFVVDLWGTSKSSEFYLPLPHAGTTSQVALLVTNDGPDIQNIRFTSNSNYSLHTEVYVTIQYTCTDR